ncbi:MAG TPA: S8 family serine peptidase [Euzebya sp.]|nr:S8 family serine peptidase [Euzebya sp.]
MPSRVVHTARRPLRRRPVAGVLLALLLTAAAVPNDPLTGQQAHLHTVRAFEAWDVRRGEESVVAVLDTGIDLDHPDLEGRLVEGIDLVERDTPPDDPQGHGTIVAGIIAATADNGRGVAGVAPLAMLMPIRVLDARGRGTSDLVAEGIRHAVSQQVDVINLSLAEVKEDEAGALPLALIADRAVQEAIAEAAAAGIVVVAAAGNGGQPSTPYEADAPLIVVGATAADDVMWEESNHDERTLFAPGTDILSTWLDGRYAKADGTSFATPIVSAGAAMLAGAGLEPDEVTRRLTETSVDIGVGLGRVDLAAAVQGVTPAPTPTTTPIPPPAEPVETPAPAPVTPAPGEGESGLEPVQPVQEVLGPPPAQVSEPPPPIATIPLDALGEEMQPLDVPLPTATPTATPTPTPTWSLRPPAAPLVLQPDGTAATRSTVIQVASALLGADVALAGWVLSRRRDRDGEPGS